MSRGTVEGLRQSVRGEVIAPNDEGYEDARRVFNAMIDRRPTFVVRCAGTDDVVAAVAFAREGSSTWRSVEEGTVFPVSEPPTTRSSSTCRACGTWRSIPSSRGPEPRGHDLGRLQRRDPPARSCDHRGELCPRQVWWAHPRRRHRLPRARSRPLVRQPLSAEIVTADGQVLTASHEENEDLFWALRGGGGNFGVVTAFEFRLHPVSDIYGGPLFFDLSDAGAVLHAYRDFIRDAPAEFGGFPAWQIAPPLPFIPEERHGETMLAFVACWAGPTEDGERALKPLRDAAPVVAEHVGAMPYPALNSAFDALYPPGDLQHYWKANFVQELTDEAIDAHLEHGPKVPVVNSTVHIYPINGACHRVAPDETAFAYRDATFATVIAGMWPDAADNEANIKWVRTTTTRWRPCPRRAAT